VGEQCASAASMAVRPHRIAGVASHAWPATHVSAPLTVRAGCCCCWVRLPLPDKLPDRALPLAVGELPSGWGGGWGSHVNCCLRLGDGVDMSLLPLLRAGLVDCCCCCCWPPVLLLLMLLCC
jgi:hypothetical protein